MPVTAAAREVLQGHFGAATLKSDPQEYLQKDFAALMETMALASGMKLKARTRTCRRDWRAEAGRTAPRRRETAIN
jgi:hypothetical protein